MLARGKRPPAEGLPQLGEQCSQLERRAEAAERELVKLKLLNFLATRIGLEMEAVVTGVEPFGLFVQGIELPAEGLVALDSLPDDTYRYDRASHTLSGRRPGHAFRLGDRVRVMVAKVDVDRRTLDFRLVGTKGRGRAAPRAAEVRRSGRPSKSNTRPKHAGKRVKKARKQRRRK